VLPEEIQVVFQPIVDMHTGDPFATEALVRCRCEALRDPPTLFQHAVVAKCCGRLGRIIREHAIRVCSARRLFLNIHPNELSDSWLVRPDEPIFTCNHEVYLEITESVPFTHFQLCLDVLQDVRSRSSDVRLVIDDLGAGYSNLSRIADLAPHIVKLDRELIVDLDKRPRRQQLAASIVRLCVEFGAYVVAEGIETHEEYLALRDAGAHYGQGYLFARPAFPDPKVTWPPLGV
jgi:EAL domain-containing protein (putative c-di-GMP-specific phosphodiesterase class I)